RALLVDHAELAPEAPGADSHRLGRDLGQRVRRAEHVDDVDSLRHVGEARVALLAEDFALARIHRNHAIAVTAQIEADEVARAECVPGQADDRDRLRVQKDALDRQGILVAREIERRGHERTSVARARARAKPCSRSQIRSSASSIPTDSRIVPGRTPAARSSASTSCLCVVLAGWMTRLFASPTFARCDHTVRPRMNSCPASRPPRMSNEKTAPGPSGRYFSTSGR